MSETTYKPNSAIYIANIVLKEFYHHRGQYITHMKLQKILYLIQGYGLALLKMPIIDEYFLAWDMGPVLRSVYDVAKDYGGQEITKILPNNKPNYTPITRDIAILIRRIVDTHGDLTTFQLSDLTHEAGTPWHKTYHSVSRSSIITNNLLMDFYYKLSQENAKRNAKR